VVLFYTQERPHIGDELATSGIGVITLEEQRQELPPAPAGPVKRRDIGGWLEARFGRIASEVYFFLKACYRFMRCEASRIWPIVRAIRQNEIQVVHVNANLRHGKPGIVAAWLTRVPSVCHVRTLDKIGAFDKLFARLVHRFIYISNAVAEGYTAQGIPAPKGTVIHNGVDLSEFACTHDAALVRSEFGWTDNERVVGVIGRLDWWKGHEYFLEAVAQVAQQIPTIRGLIVGEPEYTPRNREYFRKLQSLTGSLGLEDKVTFTGFRSDVPRLMSALDVVVLSSSAPEPFGRVVIEGMAASKPVVATAAGGVLDIIEDGVSGLLVPCKNSKAMAQAILRCLSSRAEAERIGRAARQRVAHRFTVSHHVAAVQGVYDGILDVAQNL
jgi:glycosyltransferase involved in cell wall biosynthesis